MPILVRITMHWSSKRWVSNRKRQSKYKSVHTPHHWMVLIPGGRQKLGLHSVCIIQKVSLPWFCWIWQSWCGISHIFIFIRTLDLADKFLETTCFTLLETNLWRHCGTAHFKVVCFKLLYLSETNRYTIHKTLFTYQLFCTSKNLCLKTLRPIFLEISQFACGIKYFNILMLVIVMCTTTKGQIHGNDICRRLCGLLIIFIYFTCSSIKCRCKLDIFCPSGTRRPCLMKCFQRRDCKV